MKKFLIALALLPGCSALSQALGTDPRATAPAYSGVGVVMLASPNGKVTGVKTDQSGAVGATGTTDATADQTTTTEIPAEAVDTLIQAAQTLISAGQTDAAAALLTAVTTSRKPAKAPTKPGVTSGGSGGTPDTSGNSAAPGGAPEAVPEAVPETPK